METASAIAGWDSPALDRLVEAVIGSSRSDTYQRFRQPVLEAARVQRARTLDGPRATYKVDMLTYMFEQSRSVVVSRPRAPASLSPIIWMERRSKHYVNHKPRHRDRQLRNDFLRQRYVRRWNFRLTRAEYFASLVANSDSNVATPEERLIVLPQVLWNIKHGHIRLCFLPCEEDIDDFRAQTFADDWLIEIVLEPLSHEPYTETFESSSVRGQLNRAITRQLMSKWFGSPHIDQDDLDEFAASKVYDISKTTIHACLDKLEADNVASRKLRSLSERVRIAIDNEEPFADSHEFELADGYLSASDDPKFLKTYLEELGQSFGIDIQLDDPREVADDLQLDERKRRICFGDLAAELSPKDFAMFVHLYRSVDGIAPRTYP